MSIEYSEDLHRRVRQAAASPISHVRYRRKKAEVLNEAISHPYAAAGAAPLIIAMGLQASQTTPAVRMFADPNAVSIETVQTRSVEALDSIAKTQPTALANQRSIEQLVQLYENGGQEGSEDVLSVIGRVAGHADAQTIRHHILPWCERSITTADWPNSEATLFLTTIARILASDPPIVAPLVALLKRTASADSPSATAAAAHAAGLALRDSTVASESLLSLLEPSTDDADPVVLQGVSRGAALALSGETEEIRESAAATLEALVASSEVAARTAVPTGIRQAIAGDPAVDIDPLYEFVSEALDDDDSAVQAAAVEAAATVVSVAERESAYDDESVDQFAELIETAAIGLEGEPRATAVTALRDSPVLEALASNTSLDTSQITEAVERSVVSQPGVAVPDSTSRPRLLNSSNLEIEERSDPEEDDGDDEDLSELSDEDLEERGTELAEEKVPDEATSLFESADSPERKIVTLHAVSEWFESEDTESLSSAAPWQTVLNGWNNSDSGVQAAALKAATAAICQGHIQWETGDPLYRQAWNSIDTTLREATLEQIGILLNRSCITWETAREWIDPAVEDSSINIWKRGLDAIGRGLEGGEIPVSDALPYIEDSQSSASDIVVGYGVLALARGIKGGAVDPERVQPRLESAVNSGAKALATAMTLTVGKLLTDSDITWEQARPLLLDAYEDDREDVAEKAVNGIATAVDSEAIGWSDVESLVLSTRDTSRQAVTESAVLTVAFAMRRGEVEWESISEYVEFARDCGVRGITHNAFRVVEIGLHEDELTWAQVEPFMLDALDSTTEHVAFEAVSLVARGISDEFLAWSEVSEYLRAAAGDHREGVVEASVDAAFKTALASESGFDWADTQSLLEAALETDSDEIRVDCLKTAGAAMQERSPEWPVVKEFIDSISVPDSEAGLTELMRAVITGFEQSGLNWDEVEPYLSRGLHSGLKAVAVTTVQYTKKLIIDENVAWEEIGDFLAEARTHEFPDCIEEAVACVGAALQVGLIGWETAAELLEAARSSSDDAIATEAIRAARVGLIQEQVTWDEAREFFVSSLRTTPESVIDSIMLAPMAAEMEDVIEWEQASDLFEEVVETHDGEQAATAVRHVGRRLNSGDLSWAQAADILRTGSPSSSESVQVEVAMATGAALANGAPWSQAGPFITQRFESGTPRVKSTVTSTLSSALSREEVSWESVADIFTNALTSGNDDVVHATLGNLRHPVKEGVLAWQDLAASLPSCPPASAEVVEALVEVGFYGVLSEQAHWEDIEEIAESALHSDSNDAAATAVMSAGAGLQQGTADWVDVEWLLREACESDREPVAREAMRAINVSFSQGVLDWVQAERILACGVESDHGGVVRKALSSVQKSIEEDIATWRDIEPVLERARAAETIDGKSAALKCAALATRHDGSEWDDVERFLRASLTGDEPEVQSAVVEQVRDRLSDGSLRWDQAEPLLRTARDECSVEAAVEAYDSLFSLVMDGRIRWSYIREFVTAGVLADSTEVSVAATAVVGGALQEGTVRWEEAEQLLETARDSDVDPLTAESLKAISASLRHDRIGWNDAKPFVLSLGLPESDEIANRLVSLWRASLEFGVEDLETVQTHLTAIRRCDADVALELASAVRSLITNGDATPSDVQPLAANLLSSQDPFVRIRLLGALDTYADSIEHEFEAIELLEAGLADSEVSLRDITLGVLDSLATAGAIDERTLRQLLETALADDAPTVQTRAVEVIETAIEHEQYEPQLLREVLRREISEATVEVEPLGTALDTAVEHAEWLGFGEDIYHLLITTTSSGSSTTRERSLELIAQLLASTESVSPTVTTTLESLIEERLSDGEGETRRSAAHALARLHDLGGVSVPESAIDALQEVISDYHYPAPVRVSLVSLMLDPT